MLILFSLLSFISKIFNANIENVSLPDDLKLVGVSPVCKKNNRKGKANYRPGILPALSQIFKVSDLYDQIYNNVDNILSKYQTSYQKGYSSPDCLILSAQQAAGSRVPCSVSTWVRRTEDNAVLKKVK